MENKQKFEKDAAFSAKNSEAVMNTRQEEELQEINKPGTAPLPDEDLDEVAGGELFWKWL